MYKYSVILVIFRIVSWLCKRNHETGLMSIAHYLTFAQRGKHRTAMYYFQVVKAWVFQLNRLSRDQSKQSLRHSTPYRHALSFCCWKICCSFFWRFSASSRSSHIDHFMPPTILFVSRVPFHGVVGLHRLIKTTPLPHTMLYQFNC